MQIVRPVRTPAANGAWFSVQGMATVSAGATIAIPGTALVVRILDDSATAANLLQMPSGSEGQVLYIHNADAKPTSGPFVIQSGKTQQLVYSGGAWRISGISTTF